MVYTGMTDARRKANIKYLTEKTDEIRVRVPKGQKDYYKSAAAAADMSLNQFAIAAMNEKIARENIGKV